MPGIHGEHTPPLSDRAGTLTSKHSSKVAHQTELLKQTRQGASALLTIRKVVSVLVINLESRGQLNQYL